MLSAQSDTESRQTSPEDISSSDSDEDYDSDQWNTESLQILLEDASSIDSDEGDESDSAQPNTKSRQIVQEDVSDGNVDEGSNSGGSRSVTTGGHKSTTLEQKGKQPEENRNMGQLSKLPKMPLNVLYEVRHKVDPFAGDTVDHAYSGRLYRYSLSFTRWTCCLCRGPARPFAKFSKASFQDRFG